MTQRRSWRQKSPSWWKFRGSWVFGLDLTKKGGWFLQTQRLLTKIIQNLQNLLILFFWKIPIFILHPILPPPPKKKKKLVLIPMLYLVTWVTWATQPLGSSPSTVKVSFQVSRLPLHREKHRPHYFKLGSLHSGSNPNTLWTKPGNHRNTFTKHSLFCQENFIEYHLVTLLEGCRHSLDSKCSQHVTYYSKTWYFLPYLIASSVIGKAQHSNHHRHPLGQSSFLMLSKASNSSANSPGDLNLLQRAGLCRDNSCIIFSGKTRASAHMYLEESVAQIVGRKGFEMHGWTQQWLDTWHIFQYYIYTGIIQQCPVVLILNPKVRNFLEWIRNFSSWMELWWLGISGTLDLFPRMQVTPKKTLHTFLVRESHTEPSWLPRQMSIQVITHMPGYKYQKKRKNNIYIYSNM